VEGLVEANLPAMARQKPKSKTLRSRKERAARARVAGKKSLVAGKLPKKGKVGQGTTQRRKRPVPKDLAGVSGAKAGSGRATQTVVRPRFTDPLRRAGEYENLDALLRGRAEHQGERTFLIMEDDGRELSYRALEETTARAANMLAAVGVGHGSRVAIVLPNGPEIVICLLATMRLGAVAVPLNPRLDSRRLLYLLQDSGANAVIADSALGRVVERQADQVPGLEAVFFSGTVVHEVGPGGVQLRGLAESLERASPQFKSPKIGWWDPAMIAYTGLQHERPRGAVLQHRQFLTTGRWMSAWLGLDNSDRCYCPLPLFHVYAQAVGLYGPLAVAGSVVISSEFSAARTWPAIEHHRVTTLSAVPSMLGILTERELRSPLAAVKECIAPWPEPRESPGAARLVGLNAARETGLAAAHDLRSLKRVLCGAAPLPALVQREFEQCFLVPVIEGYCLPETAGFATLNPVHGSRRIGSAGLAVGDKVAVQDERRPPMPLSGDWLPTSLPRMSPAAYPTAEPNTTGELCIWGENVLKEYLQQPELNPRAFAGGWFHTGDLALQDVDGFIYIVGQRDEQPVDTAGPIPRQVDEALLEHPAVVSVASAYSGGRCTTWVVLREEYASGQDPGALSGIRRELTAHLGRTARGGAPHDLEIVRELPRNPLGNTEFVSLRRMSRS
jgi:long-chain acyl-CoA synthetase